MGQIISLNELPIYLYVKDNSQALVKFIRVNFSSIVKQAMFVYVNHARIRSWYQPVLSKTCVGTSPILLTTSLYT